MIQRTHLFSLLIGGVFLWLPYMMLGQCDDPGKHLSFAIDPVAVEIEAPWVEGSTYKFAIEVNSQIGGSFEFRALSLKDDLGNMIPKEQISFSSSPLSLEPDKVQELVVSVSGVTKIGNYEGRFFIYQQSSLDTAMKQYCKWEIPVAVRLYEADKVKLQTGDKPVSVNTVPKSWLNFILPTKTKGKGFSVNVKNEGNTPVEIEDYSIYLQGGENSNFISEKELYLDSAASVTQILPGRTEKLTFAFNKKAKLEPDAYTGEVNLHIADRNESVQTSVTVNRKMGVGGAIIALLLGILVGRMMKDVNKEEAQDQMKLLEEFIPLRAQVAEIDDKVAKKKLLRELKSLEQKIDKVNSPETKAEVEPLLPKMSQKVQQIVEWEALWLRVEEKMQNLDLDEEDTRPEEVVANINEARDLILAGKQEGIKESLGNVQSLMKSFQPVGGPKSRSITDGSGGTKEIKPPKENTGILQSIEDLNQALAEESKKGKEEDSSSDSGGFWQKLEDILFKVMNFLTGFQVNARVRFALFRPIAMLVAFTVLVLLGFQEIYVNGDATFGTDGIYDYLKLFLWGVVSDVFSRTLLGNQKVTSFAGVSG